MATDSQSGLVVGVDEAIFRFAELLQRIERGEEITITRQGIPVARMTPIKARQDSKGRRGAVEHWNGLRASLRLGEFETKNLIDEGRR
jgi:prevent-host-death family protein